MKKTVLPALIDIFENNKWQGMDDFAQCMKEQGYSEKEFKKISEELYDSYQSKNFTEEQIKIISKYLDFALLCPADVFKSSILPELLKKEV